METKEHILELFEDLLIVRKKDSAFLISQEILNCLNSINFYNINTAKSKKEYEEMFHYYIETQEMSRKNVNMHFAIKVRDDVDRILD